MRRFPPYLLYCKTDVLRKSSRKVSEIRVFLFFAFFALFIFIWIPCNCHVWLRYARSSLSSAYSSSETLLPSSFLSVLLACMPLSIFLISFALASAFALNF